MEYLNNDREMIARRPYCQGTGDDDSCAGVNPPG